MNRMTQRTPLPTGHSFTFIRRVTPFLLAACLLSPRLAGESLDSAWLQLHPARLKAVEQVEILGNPLQSFAAQSLSSSLPSSFVDGPLAHVNKGLAEAVRGLVPGKEDACILIGTRILRLGQELWLADYPWGDKLGGALRLRSVEPARLVFVCDEKLRKQTGLDEWVVSLGQGRARK